MCQVNTCQINNFLLTWAQLWMDNLKATGGQCQIPKISTAVHCVSASLGEHEPRRGGTFSAGSNVSDVFYSFLRIRMNVISQASNAYHSKIHLCTSYTGMYVSMKVKVVLSYQLVQLTLREDAQPQG